MKKRIDIKKTLIVMGMIVILFVIGFIILSQLTKPAPKKEIKKPTITDVDEYENSIVERDRGDDRTGLFNYTLNPKIEKTIDFVSRYEWAANYSPDYSNEDVYDFKNAHIVKLSDKSELYIDGILVLNGYSVSYKDNKITIKNDDYGYRYDIVKINNDNYKTVDLYDYDNEATTEFQKIKDEYINTYAASDESAIEADGVNTYKKTVEFVKKYGVEKDVYFYTSDQIKSIMNRVFEVDFDGFSTSLVSVAKEGYVLSNIISKNTLLKDDDPLYGGHKYEAYYLLGTGKDVYAIHFYREADYVKEQATFEDLDYLQFIYPLG